MSADKRVRAVLAGCGAISRAWLGPILERGDVEMAGLVDLDEERARSLAQECKLDGALVGSDLEKILVRATPDVVFDCTVPEAHVEVTLKALAHGCHVLGEKPMADSMANARKMVAAAQRANRVYAVIQNRRYTPQVRALRAFLETGAIGRITTVHSDFFIGAHFGGFRDRMEHVLLLDMAIHTFDSARLLSGADGVSVLCHEWNPAGSWYDHEASAVAVFRMTGDVVYCYRGSWCAEGLNTSWECDWRIIGTKGSVTWDGGDGFRAQQVAAPSGFISALRDVEVPVEGGAARPTGHAGVIDAFLEALRAGATPETICTDNIRSLAMVHAAVESATTGRWVDIPQKE